MLLHRQLEESVHRINHSLFLSQMKHCEKTIGTPSTCDEEEQVEARKTVSGDGWLLFVQEMGPLQLCVPLATSTVKEAVVRVLWKEGLSALPQISCLMNLH